MNFEYGESLPGWTSRSSDGGSSHTARRKDLDVDLATFFTLNGTDTDDGQLVDALTPRATVALDKNRTLTRAEPGWSPVEHSQA